MAVGGTPKCLVTPGNRQQGAEATLGLRLENRDGYWSPLGPMAFQFVGTDENILGGNVVEDEGLEWQHLETG